MPKQKSGSPYLYDDTTGDIIGFRDADGGERFLPPVKGYLGAIASRGGVPSHFNAVNKQLMSRSLHVAMDDISVLQLVYANYYVTANGVETTPGAAGEYRAGIEYPVGNVTRVTFGGQTSGNVDDDKTLVSDPVAVTIPRGAAFYVRTWSNNSAGILYTGQVGLNNVTAAVPTSGEWWTLGVTTTDYTGVATNVNNTNNASHFRPTAIIGYTTRRSFLITGDSRTGHGTTYDTLPSSAGGVGELERSLAKRFATILVGSAGETLAQAASTTFVKRLRLAQYCSDVTCGYGINDILAGTSAATCITNLSTFANFFGGKPVYQSTLAPRSTSSDSWATTGNQTTNANNAARVTLNTAIRARLPAPFAGHIEVADQVESARDSGLWKVTGSANGYTTDGLHANSAGNALVEVSNALDDLVG